MLGLARPGEAVPLPLGWDRPGKQVQLRPALNLDTSDVLHDWSVGTSDGLHTVRLDSLDESVTRLLVCRMLTATSGREGGDQAKARAGGKSADPNQDALERSNIWFSLTVEGDILAGSKESVPQTDWRLVVAPPLVVKNQLPVPGSLLVWEAPSSAGGQLVARQTLQVAAGGAAAIHTADLRRVTSFSLYPEGYDWVERSPVVLSEGHSGAQRARGWAWHASSGTKRRARRAASRALTLVTPRSLPPCCRCQAPVPARPLPSCAPRQQHPG